MKACLSYFLTQFSSHPLILIMIVTFLESLALLGLILPGIVLMATLGTLIGSGKVSLYTAWSVSVLTCSIGDYLSYYIGWKCKNWIYKISIFQKNIIFFNKIKNILNKYSMMTILLGKLIGPTRPIIPMMAGMLSIPIKKFIFPSLISCIIWPILYFMPGIFTGAIIHHFNYTKNFLSTKYLILITIIIVLILLIIWFIRKNNKIYKICKKLK
ncbi:DedA family protein [Buchnera aphidicola]|uniref:DedA family protein n=1 Tax=Buchnera aphidicola (Sarucallis kahawaluokalani) TaxID=1241878 RepID=A0A4D6Y960_9GAMM|nr:DedA family protein [Buchnera aphidicola]QCI25899.1 DedA family protein [Buchnera aphidicola (Sarucallis kahawaluokalani)]